MNKRELKQARRVASTRTLIDAGYAAEKNGLPCEAPTTREIDRAAWEMGWRSARHEREREATLTRIKRT